MAKDTTKLSVTVPDSTVDWLRRTYPDAKSDSEAVSMAISDARNLQRILSARRVAEVRVDE
jgi:MoxR-like ATPase